MDFIGQDKDWEDLSIKPSLVFSGKKTSHYRSVLCRIITGRQFSQVIINNLSAYEKYNFSHKTDDSVMARYCASHFTQNKTRCHPRCSMEPSLQFLCFLHIFPYEIVRTSLQPISVLSIFL